MVSFKTIIIFSSKRQLPNTKEIRLRVKSSV